MEKKVIWDENTGKGRSHQSFWEVLGKRRADLAADL